MIDGLPPGAILIAGAVLAPLLPLRPRQVFVLTLPLVGLARLWLLPEGFSAPLEIFSWELRNAARS